MSNGAILAVDFGLIRVGLAVCDPDRRVAVGAGTLIGVSGRTLARTIKKHADDRNADTIVVGTPPVGARYVNEVIKGADKLADALRSMQFSVIRWDEEFTTAKALSDRKTYGGKSNVKRMWVDEAAAILILQDYLEHSNTDCANRLE